MRKRGAVRILMAFNLLGFGALVAAGLASAQTSPDTNLGERLKEFIRPTTIPAPADNPLTAEKIALGRRLFFDTRLSANDKISCASCHDPAQGFEDGLPRGAGVPGEELGRHTPTVINLAWGESFFWDGRASSLEEQALGPIEAKAEMALPLPQLVAKLTGEPSYVREFERAFGGGGITPARIGQAIASFERSLVTGLAPFDRWVSGDQSAMNDSAKRGFSLFVGKARCATCHSGWNFTDDSFHDIGLNSEDKGRFEHLPLPRMRHAFKTPGLRNIVERAPYMHDGSLPDLSAVVDHYNDGFIRRPSLSEEMRPLQLSPGERKDLVAFLQSLSAPVDGAGIISASVVSNNQRGSR